MLIDARGLNEGNLRHSETNLLILKALRERESELEGSDAWARGTNQALLGQLRSYIWIMGDDGFSTSSH